jgi:quinol monooxygenase YgiN
MRMTEASPHVPFAAQLAHAATPVVLINTFHVDPADTAAFRAAWAEDRRTMQGQPGFIRAQLHEGLGGSGVFVNVATWETTAHLGAAVQQLRQQPRRQAYPPSTVASPHLFEAVEP